MEFKQGLLFDFNGTLVPDGDLHERAWQEITDRHFAGKWSRSDIARMIRGRTNTDIVTSLLGREPEGDELAELAGTKEAAYRELCRQDSAFGWAHGAEDFLSRMKAQGRPLALATAAPLENVNFFNAHLGLERFFDWRRIVYDDGSFPGKPAPDVFLRAAAACGLEPADCTVFDDAPAGITAALAAGCGQIVQVDLAGDNPLLPGAQLRIGSYVGL